MIKNIDLITDKMKEFTFQDIKFIAGFFLSFKTDFLEGTSLLDINFIIEDLKKQYITRFRFYNPESINFESGGPFHQIHLDIHDI